MTLRKRVLWLISIMIIVTLSVDLIVVFHFYQTSFGEERKRLSELARSQARLIESIFRINQKYNRLPPDEAKAATISQLIEFHNRFERFSLTGELLLAEREGNKIHFFFGHKRDEIIKPDPVSSHSGLAEPMLLALSGESGTTIGFDYDGIKVIAAYEHVTELNFGIVAKVDISEIRAPLVKATFAAVFAGIIAVALGVFLFIKITNPMIKQMSSTIENLEDALKRVKLLSGFLPICASCKKIRDDKGYWNQVEAYIEKHSEAEFSHSICPECSKKLYPELFEGEE